MVKTTKGKKKQAATAKTTAKTTAKRTVGKKTIKTAAKTRANNKPSQKTTKKPAKTSARKTAVFPKLDKTLKAKPKLFKVLAIASVVVFAFIGLFVARNQFIASNNGSGSAVLGIDFNDAIPNTPFYRGAFAEVTLGNNYNHKGVTWTSSDRNIARVMWSKTKPGNAFITFFGVGKAVVSANLANGQKVSHAVNVEAFVKTKPLDGFKYTDDLFLNENVRFNMENGCSIAKENAVKQAFSGFPRYLKNIAGVVLLKSNSFYYEYGGSSSSFMGLSLGGYLFINCDTTILPAEDILAHEISHSFDFYYMTYSASGEKLSDSPAWVNIYNKYNNLYSNASGNYSHVTFNDSQFLSSKMELFAETHAMYLSSTRRHLVKPDIQEFFREYVKDNPSIGNGGVTEGSWAYNPDGLLKDSLIQKILAIFKKFFLILARMGVVIPKPAQSVTTKSVQTPVHPIDLDTNETDTDVSMPDISTPPAPDPVNHGKIDFARWTNRVGNYGKVEFYSNVEQDGYSMWCYDSAKNKYGKLFNANSDDKVTDIKDLSTQVSSTTGNMYSRGIHKYKNRDCYIAGYKYYPQSDKNILGKPMKINQ